MWIIVIIVCIAIAFGVYKFKKWSDEQDAYEQKRQEEAKKKAEFEAWQEKRKAIYKKHLHNIYDGVSRKKLEQIFELLETMRCNRSAIVPGYPGFSSESQDIYFEAQDKLLILLNHPKWNIGNGWSKSPLWVEIDSNYVYELLNY